MNLRVKGFTLIEVLVAMALLAITGAALMALVDLSGLAVRDARADIVETFAAQSKMAELRAAAGAEIGGSLESSLSGYSDFVTVDGDAAPVSASSRAPATAAYVRRWQVSPAPYDPAATLVLQVVATRVGRPNARDVHLVSLLARAYR